METLLQFEEYINTNKGNNDLTKISLNFFENKTRNINKEIESIKEFLKFFISQVKINDNFISELNNLKLFGNETLINKKKNIGINPLIKSKSLRCIEENNNLVLKDKSKGKLLQNKVKKESDVAICLTDLSNEDKKISKICKHKTNLNNLHNKSPYYNKILNSNLILKTESSKKLPKLIPNINTCQTAKSNFEKFISTTPKDKNKIGAYKSFYIKHQTFNNENEKKIYLNTNLHSLNISDNSNFSVNGTYSPLSFPKNSNSVSNLANLNFQNHTTNQINGLHIYNNKNNFSFKNNILRENQKSIIKNHLISLDLKKKFDIEPKVKSPPKTNISNSIINNKSIASSKLKIDNYAINSKLISQSKNSFTSSLKNDPNKIIFENVKLLQNLKDSSQLSRNLEIRKFSSITDKPIKTVEKYVKKQTTELNNESKYHKKNSNSVIKYDFNKICNSFKTPNEASNSHIDYMNRNSKIEKNTIDENRKSSIYNNENILTNPNLKNNFKFQKNNENLDNKFFNRKFKNVSQNKIFKEIDFIKQSNYSPTNSVCSNKFYKDSRKKKNIFTVEKCNYQSSEGENTERNSNNNKVNYDITPNQNQNPNKKNSAINIKNVKNNNINNNLETNQSSSIHNMKKLSPSILLENRKFSILDIQGPENLNNLRELIEKNNREQQKNGSDHSSDLRNISGESESNNNTYNNSFKTYDLEDEKNNLVKKLSSIKMKSIFLMIFCETTSLKEKINLFHSCPSIYKIYSVKKILIHQSQLLNKMIEKNKKNVIKELEEEDNYRFEDLETNFIPTRTAVNHLNFISKNDSDLLKDLQINDIVLFNFINILYIMLNENFSLIKKEDIIRHIFDNIFKKHKIEHISK